MFQSSELEIESTKYEENLVAGWDLTLSKPSESLSLTLLENQVGFHVGAVGKSQLAIQM